MRLTVRYDGSYHVVRQAFRRDSAGPRWRAAEEVPSSAAVVRGPWSEEQRQEKGYAAITAFFKPPPK